MASSLGPSHPAKLAVRRGEPAFDNWSWVHVASGAALALLGSQWWLTLALLIAYEALEGGLRRIKTKDGGLFEFESWKNIGADIVVGMAGFAVLAVAGVWITWW